MKKLKEYGIVQVALLATFGMLFSCTEKGLETSPAAVKDFSLVGEEAEATTRTTIDNGRNVQWKVNDVVHYYCLKTDGITPSGNSSSSTVTATGKEANVIHVNYDKDNDKYIAVYFKADKIGGATETSGESLTFASGIPVTQNGTREPYHIAVGYKPMDQNTITMCNVQSYISFSLKDIRIGGKDINKIQVVSHDPSTPAVAGNLVVNPKNVSTAAVSLSGGANTVTVKLDGDENFSVNTTYYVAIRQGLHTGGIRINFLNGSTIIGFADATKNLNLGRGTVLDLGELKVHSTVMGTNIVLHPNSVSFTKDMEKKIWVEFTPSDVTKVTWSVSNSKNESGTTVADNKIISTVHDGGVVTYRGGTYIEGTLVPGGTRGTCTVTATLEGGAKTADVAVEVGDFVDMGLTRHWAAANLKGSYNATPASNTLTICDKPEDWGGYYMWGWVTEREQGVAVTASNYGSRWTGCSFTESWNTSRLTYAISGNNGYTSTQTPSKTQLDLADDAAYNAKNSNKKWRIPSINDWKELKDTTVRLTTVKNGVVVFKYTSEIEYYDDTYILIPFSGDLERAGSIVDLNARAGYWTRNHSETVLSDKQVFGYCDGTSMTQQYGTDLPAWTDATREDSGTAYGHYGRITGFSIRPVRKSDKTNWSGTEE